MRDGIISIVEWLVYGAIDRVEKKYGADPFKTFTEAMNNVKRCVEVTSVRVGSAEYQMPSPVDEKRGNALAIRWIVDTAQKRSSHSMIGKLAE